MRLILQHCCRLQCPLGTRSEIAPRFGGLPSSKFEPMWTYFG